MYIGILDAQPKIVVDISIDETSLRICGLNHILQMAFKEELVVIVKI